MDFKFFTENIKKSSSQPRTREEVEQFVRNQMNFLYDGRAPEQAVVMITNQVCGSLNIN